MLGKIGTPELVLILLIVMIIFGVGKLSQVGGALGNAIRDFRKASKEGENPKEVEEDAVKMDEANKPEA